MRNRKIKVLSVALIVIAIIMAVFATLFYFKSVRLAELQKEKAELESTLNANKQVVYVAAGPILKGERIITSELEEELNKNNPEDANDEITAGAVINNEVKANVYKTEIYTSLGVNSYITEDMIGQVAIVDIAEDEPVMTNMVRELNISQDTREYEIVTASLMVDQEENDYVDIRLVYPNGEDYTVLSKKQIKNLSLQNSTFFTDLDESEILTYQSAVMDAYHITGTRIYTTRYVESNLQENAVPNYIPRASTLDLIQTDPNIYAIASSNLNASARLSLENRLNRLTEDQLDATVSGWGIADTAKTAVLVENADVSLEDYEDYEDIKEDEEKDSLEDVSVIEDEEDKTSDEEDVRKTDNDTKKSDKTN